MAVQLNNNNNNNNNNLFARCLKFRPIKKFYNNLPLIMKLTSWNIMFNGCTHVLNSAVSGLYAITHGNSGFRYTHYTPYMPTRILSQYPTQQIKTKILQDIKRAINRILHTIPYHISSKAMR
jgi:hypothetical protein